MLSLLIKLIKLLYIALLVFVFCNSNAQSKGVILSSFKINPCTYERNYDPQMMLKEDFANKQLSLSFDKMMNCCTYDTFTLNLHFDTLRISPATKSWMKQNKGFKQVGSPLLDTSAVSCDCYCLLNIEVKIGNLKKKPLVYIFNDLNRPDSTGVSIYTKEDGFVNYRSFRRFRSKVFHDNSDIVSYNELHFCIGKPIAAPEFQAVLKKLGNDSIIEFGDENFIKYPVDEITFGYDASGILTSIELTDYFRKHASILLYIGNQKHMLDTYLGTPEIIETGQCIDRDEKGNEKYVDCWFDCYYRSEYLRIKYSKDHKIEEIELRF